jgi:hypothetical protein
MVHFCDNELEVQEAIENLRAAKKAKENKRTSMAVARAKLPPVSVRKEKKRKRI